MSARHLPVLKLFLPFALGIITCSYFPVAISFPYWFSIALWSVLLLIYVMITRQGPSHSHRFSAGAVLTFFFLGYLLTSSSRPMNKPEFSSPDPQASFLEIQLTQDPIERAKTFKSEAVILRYVNDTIHVSGEPILVYLPKSETPKYGDRYLLTSQLVAVAPPTNPDAFNYKRYLFHHHIRNQLFIRENHIIRKSSGHGHPILSQTSRWRRKASDKLVELGIQGDELAIINALLLGQKELLTESITKAYSGAGAMHVLAVSGLHVGIVLLLLNTLLKPMEASKSGRVTKRIILIIGIWLYACLTGLSPSVIRASTMFSFIVLGQSLGRTSSIYNSLIVSAFVILLFKPFMIMEVGMQLSYAAVLGIVIIQPRLYERLHFNQYVLDKAWQITCVSIAAQLATFPLGLLYFHQFPSYFPISNLIVIPAATGIIFMGMAVFATSFYQPVAFALSYVLKHFVRLINSLILQINELPGALIEGLHISTFQAWILVAMIIAIAVYLHQFKRGPFQALLLISVFFISTFTLIKAFRTGRNELTFYATNSSHAIQFTEGSQAVFYAPKNLLNDEQAMLFHIKHHWWAQGIRTPHIVETSLRDEEPLNGYLYPFIFNSGTRIVLLSDETLPPYDTLSMDYLYVSDLREKPDNLLPELINPKSIVVGRRVSHAALTTLETYSQEHNIPLHNLNTSGALVEFY